MNLCKANERIFVLWLFVFAVGMSVTMHAAPPATKPAIPPAIKLAIPPVTKPAIPPAIKLAIPPVTKPAVVVDKKPSYFEQAKAAAASTAKAAADKATATAEKMRKLLAQLGEFFSTLPAKFQDFINKEVDFEKSTFKITAPIDFGDGPKEFGLVINLGMAGTGMEDSEEQVLQPDGSVQTAIVQSVPLSNGFGPGHGTIVPAMPASLKTVISIAGKVAFPGKTINSWESLIRIALSSVPQAQDALNNLLVIDSQKVFVLKLLFLMKTAQRKPPAERASFIAKGTLQLLVRLAYTVDPEATKKAQDEWRQKQTAVAATAGAKVKATKMPTVTYTPGKVLEEVLEKLHLKSLVDSLPKMSVSEREYLSQLLPRSLDPTAMQMALGAALGKKGFTPQVTNLTTVVKEGFTDPDNPDAGKQQIITSANGFFDREQLVKTLVGLVGQMGSGIGTKDADKVLTARARLLGELIAECVKKMEAAGVYTSQAASEKLPFQADFLYLAKQLQKYLNDVVDGKKPAKPDIRVPEIGAGKRDVDVLGFVNTKFAGIMKALDQKFAGDAGWVNDKYLTIGPMELLKNAMAILLKVMNELPKAASLFKKTDEGKAKYAELVGPAEAAAKTAKENLDKAIAALKSQPSQATKNMFNEAKLAYMRAGRDLMKASVAFKNATLKFAYKRTETAEPESLSAFIRRELVSALRRLEIVRRGEGQAMAKFREAIELIRPIADAFGFPLPSGSELEAQANEDAAAEEANMLADIADIEGIGDFGDEPTEDVAAEEPVEEASVVEAAPAPVSAPVAPVPHVPAPVAPVTHVPAPVAPVTKVPTPAASVAEEVSAPALVTESELAVAVAEAKKVEAERAKMSVALKEAYAELAAAKEALAKAKAESAKKKQAKKKPAKKKPAKKKQAKKKPAKKKSGKELELQRLRKKLKGIEGKAKKAKGAAKISLQKQIKRLRLQIKSL